jgi:hypothetical protein
MKNLFGKSVEVETPYAVFRSPLMAGWEWRVLKTYQSKVNEDKNIYARWFCAVKSPFTFGSWEYGDTYISDILREAHAELVECVPAWHDTYKLWDLQP